MVALELQLNSPGVSYMRIMLKLLLLPVLLSLAACGGATDTTTPVRAHKKVVTQNSPTTSLGGRAKIDPDKLPEDKKAIYLSMKEDMKSILRWMDESHQIFSESWKVIWNSPRAQVYSVFKHALQLLETKVSSSGEMYLESGTCEGFQIAIKISNMSPREYWVQSIDCNQRHTEILFKLKKSTDKKFEVEFVPMSMKKGVGDALSLLNQKISCLMEGNVDNNLEKLRCENLGQSFDYTRYLEMKIFEYSRQNNKTLHIVGSKYRALQDKESDIDLLVPLEGKIIYKEVEVLSENEEQSALRPENIVNQEPGLEYLPSSTGR